MSPTVLQLTGPANVFEYSTLSGRTDCVASFFFDEIIHPPKNVAGKQCLVEAAYCNFETTRHLPATDTPNQIAYFGWNVNSLWSQIYTSPNAPMMTPALGSRDLNNDNYFRLGNRVVRINDGPFPIRFFCYQQDSKRRLTQGYYPSAKWYMDGTAPSYTSVTITAGTNDVLTLTRDGVTETITIPEGSYTTAASFASVVAPLMPSSYLLHTDANNTNTRLRITTNSDSKFVVGGTARTALGFNTTALEYNDYTNMTVVLHLTPIE